MDSPGGPEGPCSRGTHLLLSLRARLVSTSNMTRHTCWLAVLIYRRELLLRVDMSRHLMLASSASRAHPATSTASTIQAIHHGITSKLLFFQNSVLGTLRVLACRQWTLEEVISDFHDIRDAMPSCQLEITSREFEGSLTELVVSEGGCSLQYIVFRSWVLHQDPPRTT